MKDKIVKIILDERTTLDPLPGVFDGDAIRVILSDGTSWYSIYLTASDLIELVFKRKKK